MERIITELDISPSHEKERLKELQRYKLVNGLPKNYFSKLAHKIASTFKVPIALVSIVDKERVAFPGNYGIPNIEEIPRSISLCSIALLKDHPTVYTNTLEEPELLTNPLIAGDFGLRFYAGAPIITNEGYALGVVCIVDKKPRTFSEENTQKLQVFASMAMKEISSRLSQLY